MYNGIKVVSSSSSTVYTIEESVYKPQTYRCVWWDGSSTRETQFVYSEQDIEYYLGTGVWLPANVVSGSEQESDLYNDKGKHYRYAFRLNLTQEDIDSGFVMVNVDPYRISEVYNLGGWREHLVKKAIRGTEKGHTEDELLEELQCTLDRAKQMLEESRE